MGIDIFSHGAPPKVESVPEMKKKLDELDLRLNTKENPKLAEYLKNIKEKVDWYFERIKTKSGAVLMRIEQMQNDPNGADGVTAALETLKELYADAIEMRAEMFPDKMRKEMGLEPGADIEGALSKGLDTLGSMQSKDGRNIGEELGKIAKGLSDEPVDVLSAQNAKSRYWELDRKTGFPSIKPRQVSEDEENLQQIKNEISTTQTFEQHKELGETIKKLELGIAELKRVDPAKTATYEWQIANAPRKMDTKPLRVLGILGGGLIGGLGLGHALVKGHDVTWPTVMWAGVAAYSLNPTMFQGKTKDAIQAFKKYNSTGYPKTIGRLNMQAFVELRDKPKSELKAFRAKMAVKEASEEQITPADIGTFAEKNASLYNVLVKLKDNPKQLLATIDLVIDAPKKDLAIIEEIIEHK